jgi:hypothetical protein
VPAVLAVLLLLLFVLTMRLLLPTLLSAKLLPRPP